MSRTFQALANALRRRCAICSRVSARLVSLFIGIHWAALSPLAAQSEPSLDFLPRWVTENLDERIVATVGELDEQQVATFQEELIRRLQGTNVYELAELTAFARQGLSLLAHFDEARPYAAWLESHLDFFTAAEDLYRIARPPRVGALPLAPTTSAQEKVWSTHLEKRRRPTRADIYVPLLKPVFDAAGLPSALVWLGEVESSFEPAARSPVGAVGMFQLMPATARSLGLALDPHDERLDPHKNARAAARYLRHLHRRFGNWPLALAAYNAGETRVQRLLRSAKADSYAAIATQLPAETQMYVPKIDATLRKRENLSLATLEPPAQ